MNISATKEMTEEEPLVSVVVPVYNVSAYLLDCLDSLINQTYRNIEIIVIDDGSTDDSPAICDRYAQKDSRIRVTHKNNQGLSHARNNGIAYAIGEYILFLDSDDWIDTKAIETLLRIIRNSHADIATAGFITEYKDKQDTPPVDKERIAIVKGQQILSAFYDGTISDVAWNKLYRIDCFKKLCFPVGRYYEDIATSWKLMKSLSENDGTVAVLSDILFHYRVRRSSISHSRSFKKVADYWEAYFEQYNEIPEYRAQILTGCFIAIGKMWSGYGGFSKEEKEKAAGLIEKMHVFSKEHFHQVIKGEYPGKVKLYCRLSQSHSPAVMRLCYYIGTALMRVRDHRRNGYD